MDLELKDRRVLITGASQGIGEALANGFAGEGCHLELVSRSEKQLQDISRSLQETYGVTVRAHAQDLSHRDAASRVARAAGDVDILVNNAGAIPTGDLLEVDADAWRAGWDVKVYGYIDLTRHYYRQMEEQGGGVILNNIGYGGENFDFDYIAGTTGNAALMGFTRALGGRSVDDGIRVVGVNPGPVDTDRIRRILKRRAAKKFDDEMRYTELLENYPFKRAAAPKEIVDLFLFLASPRSGYTSGTIFTIDGGATSRRSI